MIKSYFVKFKMRIRLEEATAQRFLKKVFLLFSNEVTNVYAIPNFFFQLLTGSLANKRLAIDLACLIICLSFLKFQKENFSRASSHGPKLRSSVAYGLVIWNASPSAYLNVVIGIVRIQLKSLNVSRVNCLPLLTLMLAIKFQSTTMD